MKYDKLKELMDYFAAYEEETGSQDIASFSHWLQKKSTESVTTQGSKLEQQINERVVEGLGKINNYLKHYIKKVTKDSPFAGWNDLVAMAILYHSEDRRKTELIQIALMELSPGMEVVRRLLRQDLIKEFPDPKDKRAKRISLTDKGKKLYREMEEKIQRVNIIVNGNLNPNEKQQFLYLLEKLQQFHYPIWVQDQEGEITQILEKYSFSTSMTHG
ncbi:MAG: MarR family winged helix-turn-helix transcriptional regulator [Bacteroidota bacterium]